MPLGHIYRKRLVEIVRETEDHRFHRGIIQHPLIGRSPMGRTVCLGNLLRTILENIHRANQFSAIYAANRPEVSIRNLPTIAIPTDSAILIISD